MVTWLGTGWDTPGGGGAADAAGPLRCRWRLALGSQADTLLAHRTFTTGQLFLHSCLHFLGLHLRGMARAAGTGQLTCQ